MPRRPNARKVRTHAVYTVQELAETVDVHPMTVRRWIREDGLPAVTDRKPWLIDGRDAKLFLADSARAAKCPLKRDEFDRLSCRDRRRPDGGLVDYLPRTPEVGRLVGLCPACGTEMHRVMRRADLARLPADIDVALPMAVTRISGSPPPIVNVHFEGDSETHVKAHV